MLAGLLAVGIDRTALQTRGLYLALVTIGVVFIVRVAIENISFIGGVAGLSGMPGVNPVARGRRRAGGRAAAVVVAVFVVGAALASVASSLYAHYVAFISPDAFDIPWSIFVVLEGVNNMWGAARDRRDDGAFGGIRRLRRVAANHLWDRHRRPAAGASRGAAAVLQAEPPRGALNAAACHRPSSQTLRGVLAVDDVSFDVAEESVVGLIGPNGAGKTALINLVTGFYAGGELLTNSTLLTGYLGATPSEQETA